MTNDDFAYELRKSLGFFANQLTTGYRVKDGIFLRIKDHAPNYSYISTDIYESNGGIKRVVVVNVGGQPCRNESAMTMQEFADEYPEILVVELTINAENMTVEEAVEVIKQICC